MTDRTAARSLQAPVAHRAASLAASVMITLSILAGVNVLATHGVPSDGVLAHQASPSAPRS